MDESPRMLSCEELLEQLQDYLDADARAELCRAVEHHLSGCGSCKVYLDSVRRTIVLYHREERVEMPPRLCDRLRAALERAYGGADPHD